jgi:peptidylprolyl isomerase
MKKWLSLFLVLVVLVSGCTLRSDGVKEGDTIKVHYWLTVDGQLLETSENSTPIEFTVGGGQMIAGFDQAVVGMKVGTYREISIPPAGGYGEYDEKLRQEVFANDTGMINVSIGDMIQIGTDAGLVPGYVTEIGEDVIVVDGNHPLAGQILDFRIELVEIIN